MATTRSFGSGTAAIARALFDSDVPMTQVDLAARCAVTQPRVSQALKLLEAAGAVARTVRGYVVLDGLAAVYAVRYRPVVDRDEQLWLSLASQREQVEAIAARYPKVVVSADYGADLIAAWRRPTHTIIYTEAPIDLVPLRFVPAADLADASIRIRATSDWRLLSDSTTVNSIRVAHRLQIAADLCSLGGADRVEAAGRTVSRQLL